MEFYMGMDYGYFIDDLELPVKEYNALKRAGINTIRDLKTYSRPEHDLGNYSPKDRDNEDIIEKVRKRIFPLEEYSEIVKDGKEKHTGKIKCEKLREIRKKIAEVNNIPYSPAECNHDGPCAGTCPYCDAELMYLDCELQKKKERGEEVYLSGLAIEVGKNQFDYPNYDDLVQGITRDE